MLLENFIKHNFFQYSNKLHYSLLKRKDDIGYNNATFSPIGGFIIAEYFSMSLISSPITFDAIPVIISNYKDV